MSEALEPVTLSTQIVSTGQGRKRGGAEGMSGPAAGLQLAERLHPRSRAAGLPPARWGSPAEPQSSVNMICSCLGTLLQAFNKDLDNVFMKYSGDRKSY